MSETQNKQESQEPTAEQKQEKPQNDPAELAKMINEAVNSAVTSHLKRTLPKMIEAASKSKQQPTQEAAPNETDPDPTNAKIATLERKIADLTKREREAREAARKEKTVTNLAQTLRGKVADDWLDIAVERLSSKVEYDESDAPTLKINDGAFSIDEGASEWLKAPENKRFLPAPKTPARPTAPAYQPPTVAGKELSFDEKIQLAAAELAKTGSTLR